MAETNQPPGALLSHACNRLIADAAYDSTGLGPVEAAVDFGGDEARLVAHHLIGGAVTPQPIAAGPGADT